MRNAFAVCLLVLGLLGAGSRDAFAQDTAPDGPRIYVKVYGINGPLSNGMSGGWIEALSLKQAWSAAGLVKNGCEIEFVKALDKSGPHLWLYAVTGKYIQQAEIEVFAGGSQTILIYRLFLEDVRISAITTSGGDALLDRVTLAVIKSVQVTSFGLLSEGSSSGAVTTQWSCEPGQGRAPR